jgi:hypothetical protein
MSSDDEGGLDLFQEPADYFKPEKEATLATHKLLSGKDFTVRLVGHNPLWVRLHHSLDMCTSKGLHGITLAPAFTFSKAALFGIAQSLNTTTELRPFLTMSTAIAARSLTFVGTLSLERRSNNIRLSGRACRRTCEGKVSARAWCGGWTSQSRLCDQRSLASGRNGLS